jgi:hypothetical protein
MATRFSAFQVLSALDKEEFGLEEEEDSDYEGDEVLGYLPEVSGGHLETIHEDLSQQDEDEDEDCQVNGFPDLQQTMGQASGK